MIAINLASKTLSPLKRSDSVQTAMRWLLEFKLSHAPVVDGDTFIGLISEEILLEQKDSGSEVGSLLSKQAYICVEEDAHLYDVIKWMGKFTTEVFPVVNREMKYKGLISQSSVIEATARLLSVENTGGIIVLEIDHKNNSLAYISQIVESENAQILSSSVLHFPNSSKLELTLKVNRTDLSAIVSAFNRYNYTVLGVYSAQQEFGDSDDRYNSLMNYLNV